VADTQVDWNMLGYKDITVNVIQEQPPAKPSVTVNVTPNPALLTDNVKVYGVVRNEDDTHVITGGTLTIKAIDASGNEHVLGTQSIGTINARDSTTYSITFVPKNVPLSEGDYTIKTIANVTFDDHSTDTAEASTTLTIKKEEVFNEPQVTLSASRNNLTLGDSVTFTVEIKNPNSFSVTCDAGVIITKPDGSHVTLTTGMTGLTIGAGQTVTKTVSYTPDKAGNYQARAQAVFKHNDQEKSAYSNTVSFVVNEPSVTQPEVTLTVDKTTITAGDTVTATVKVTNRDQNYALENATVKIVNASNQALWSKSIASIDPGKSVTLSAQLMLTESTSLTATVSGTINGKSVYASSQPVQITVNPPEQDDFSLTIGHPSEANAGDVVTFNVSIKALRGNIQSATVDYTYTQRDGSGNVVASGSNSIAFGSIPEGQSDAKNVLIATKSIAGTLYVEFKATANFEDGKSFTKSQTATVTLTSSGGGGGGGGGSGGGTGGGTGGGSEGLGNIEGLLGQVVEYAKAHPLIVAGVGIGFLLLLVSGRRGQQVVYYPPAPAYPPAYPYPAR